MKTLIKYFRQFIDCHDGTLNRAIHMVGFFLIGLGIIEKSLWLVFAGGVTQELGHMYQYAKTHKLKDSPLYCLKPQSVFAFPIFILIVLYVIVTK